MPPGRKQGSGCWTCRLRRKRCDSVRPVCGSCRGLDIPCHTGEPRPEWMDGGDGQQRMARTLKQAIKQNALLRKERRRAAHEHHDMVITTASDFEASTEGAQGPVPPATASTGIPRTSAPNLRCLESLVGNNSRPPSLGTSVKPESPFAKAIPASRAAATDSGCSSGPCRSMLAPAHLESVASTLDFVWPFLFPFHRPLLTDLGAMGRQWLLGLLHQDESAFHMYQSMCDYLLSLLARNDGHEWECECKALVWDRLVEKTGLAQKVTQDTVTAFWQQGAESPLPKKTRVMGMIAQLVVVETTIRRDVDWAVNLTPALTLFDEILKHHGVQQDREPSLAAVLDALAPVPSFTPLPEQPERGIIWTTEDQSSFVFYSALLLFYDIVASTALGNAPALQRYHCTLLSTPSEERFPVRLESLVGCQNWALVTIGRISTLCAWKRDAKQSGHFSAFKFVNLARPISEALESGLAGLDGSRSQSRVSASGRRKGYYRRYDRAVDGTPLETVTRIWAHAGKLYLSVTLSGWQPNCEEVQHSVTEILRLLQTIESPAQLQSLTWPMCVAGCLALPHQDQDFRTIVEDIGALAQLGTSLSALRIMEAAWGARGTVDRDSWDIASALNVLGSPSLLV